MIEQTDEELFWPAPYCWSTLAHGGKMPETQFRPLSSHRECPRLEHLLSNIVRLLSYH
jgi:hypothetical protein